MSLFGGKDDPYGKWIEAKDLPPHFEKKPLPTWNAEEFGVREFYRNLTEQDKRFLKTLKIEWSVE